MKKEIKIRQHDKQDCAAACLASIASFYGLRLPLIKIREACGTSGTEGTNIKGIIDAATAIGMSGKAFKSSDKDSRTLINVPKPTILHLQKEDGWLHFVVLYEINKKEASILDPEDGNIHKISLIELNKIWTGYIVVLTPSANFKKGDSRTNILSRFKDLLNINKKELIPALFGSIVYIIIGLSTSLFIQQIIDNVLPSRNNSMLILFSVVMFALMLLSMFIEYFRTIFTIRAGIKIDASLIIGYINKILRLPVSFFQNRTSGELNSRIGDAYRIRSFLTGRLLVIFISIVSLLLSFGMLFTYYWKLALLTLMSVPLYVLLYIISDKINKKTNKEIIEAAARFQDVNIETLTCIDTVRYFGAEENFSRRVEKRYVEMAQSLYKGGRNIAAFSTSSDGITKLLTLVVIISGSLFVFNSELTIGELVSFYSIATFFSAPLIALIDSNNQITEAQIAAQRLFEIMDLDSEDCGETLPYIPQDDDAIRLNQVSFTYPGRLELFNNISLTIERGKITAFVGDNGCGKSTIASLLMRGVAPKEGAITIGNIDIKQLDLAKWREYISIVPQRTSLFNGTIIENIAPYENNPNIKRILELCYRCGLGTLIEKTGEGLLTKVGEQGKFLSEGERHKIALVRALYRAPKVLILDEITAFLDKESVTVVLNLIKELSTKGMTIIMISHEQRSIEIADTIFEIERLRNRNNV